MATTTELHDGHELWMLSPLMECESPIEEKFLEALVDGCRECEQTARVEVNHRIYPVTPNYHSPRVLEILPQERIGRLRVDFALYGLIGGDCAHPVVIVECDGHDFHERTRDQAARDRQRDRVLQAGGFTVFRFTGSEIYRDAAGCARECLRYIIDQWGARVQA